MTLVSVGIVTWNAATVLERCLDAVRRQTHDPIEVLVVDNASSDGTPALLGRLTRDRERLLLAENTGFAAAHNRAIERSAGQFYLALNPDVFLETGFVERLVNALVRTPRAGSASGKLCRADAPDRIDSAGIRMLPSQRPLDRGGGALDTGQYDVAEYVFGASGAAALYRRAMLEDCRVAGEIFDEDFFAYREDADLAWRAQLLGWECVYVPEARARHVRHVTSERRATLSAAINRYSVRNRFLLPALWRDLQVIAYVVAREHTSLPAILDVLRLLPRTIMKRREIMRRRRTPSARVDRWFLCDSRPLEPAPTPTCEPSG